MRAFPAVSCLVLFLLAIASPHRTAQAEESRTKRPKIGLVLSGGGAVGAAHIGVIKALEEMRIPIDFIAGTSMGAVVGGLYASGMSPEAIEAWFRQADWHFLLSDSLPRKSESFETKQRQFDMNQGIAYNVSLQDGLTLPAGFIRGRNIMAALRQLTVPVRQIHDFNRLPIPFRAVATDIETGEMVILRNGDFVESIRASMGIPAIFTPQAIGDRLLADGGMTSNLPIRVAQEMGADIIIAVDLSEPLAKGANIRTAGAMANQVLSIFVQRQMREEIARLGANDALLRVKVAGMGPTDFAKSAVAIDAGYEQTIAQRARLARFAAAPQHFRQYLSRQRIPNNSPLLVSSIKVKTPEGEFEHPLTKPLEFTVDDQERFAQLQSLISDTGEMQKFEVSDYELLGDGKDGYSLLVKAQKKKTGPNDLSFGFGIDYSTTDDSDFSLRLSYRMTELNSLGAQWRTFLSLGDTTYLSTEWYQPLDWERRFFIAVYGQFGSDWINGRDAEDDPLRFRLQDQMAGLDVGARLWQWGEVRLGYGRGYSRISRRLGVADEVPTTVDRGWLHADFTFDTLDTANFSTKGHYGRAALIASREEFGASDNYMRFEGQYFHPITFGKNTIVPRVTAALKVGSDEIPIYDQVPLGGFLNLSGLSRGTLFGENAAVAELIYYRKLGNLTPGVGRGVYGGFSLEAGEVWSEDFNARDAILAGSIFVGADTGIGALYLGVGVAEGGDAAIYLQLGTPFGQGRHQR